MWETWVWPLSWENPLEKRKATHSSILAWRTGSQRVRHDWVTFTFIMNKSTFLSSLTNDKHSNLFFKYLSLLIVKLIILSETSFFHLLACQMHFGSLSSSNLNFSCSRISNKSSKLLILGFHAISYTCHFYHVCFFLFSFSVLTLTLHLAWAPWKSWLSLMLLVSHGRFSTNVYEISKWPFRNWHDIPLRVSR